MSARSIVVDAHHHWIPSDHARFTERYVREGERVTRDRGQIAIARDGVQVSRIAEIGPDVDAHLRDMASAGVDAAIFSLGLWMEWLTLAMAKEANDELAEIQRRHRGRILGLAHVPPLDEGTERELRRAVRELGLVGVNLTTHWRGRYLDDPAFRPLLRTIAELDVPIVIHASALPGECRVAHEYGLGPLLGRAVDQLTAITRLVASGALEELPTLRIVAPHLGGGFFALRRRVGLGVPGSSVTRHAAGLARVWFDTAPAGWEPAELALAVANLGADHVVFGSDYPVQGDWLASAVAALGAAPIDDAARAAVMGGNAAALFRIDAATPAS